MYNQAALSTKYKIQTLNFEVMKIQEYREQLGRAIMMYQVNHEDQIKIPF